jgi:hypothetical protein
MRFSWPPVWTASQFWTTEIWGVIAVGRVRSLVCCTSVFRHPPRDAYRDIAGLTGDDAKWVNPVLPDVLKPAGDSAKST